MAYLKGQRIGAIHERALREFHAIHSATYELRLQSREDRRFYSIAGAMWEGALGEQFENKIKLEVNKVHQSVLRIVNEYRNNRITVDFIGGGSDADADLAATCDGLYRADEERSNAQEAYDAAFEEAVAGGFGAWRLVARYEDEEDEQNSKQVIDIEPIFDADLNVYFDLDAKRQDKKDAQHCFVLVPMTRDRYREEYDQEPASWPVSYTPADSLIEWSYTDVVYVAEYYTVTERRETIYTYRQIDGTEKLVTEGEFDRDPTLQERLDAEGSLLIDERDIKRKRVRKYIMDGAGVLEDSGEIPGGVIPIVPCFGKRWYVDNVERFMGHVRLAKDPQRLKNMQLSKLADLAARSSIEKPIVAPEQIEGHQYLWANDAVQDYPVMLLNLLTDANGQVLAQGPLGYTKPPMIAPAMAALLQVSEQDIQEILGKQDAGSELLSNVSGKAVELVQTRLDMQSFIYVSNFAKAMRQCGRIWLAMARELLVEEGRTMRTLGREGERGQVTLGDPRLDEQTGEVVLANDITKAKFDIIVDIGPATEAKRASAVRALSQLVALAQNPEDHRMLLHLAFRLLDIDGTDEAKKYSRKVLVSMGAEKPTEEEEAAMEQAAANQQPNAQDQLMAAATEELRAKAMEAMADTEYTAARTQETRAKTAETLAGIDQAERRLAIDAARELAQATAGPSQSARMEQ